jgi:hypothetical protein
MNKEDQIKKYMIIARDYLEEAFELLKQRDVHEAIEKI